MMTIANIFCQLNLVDETITSNEPSRDNENNKNIFEIFLSLTRRTGRGSGESCFG